MNKRMEGRELGETELSLLFGGAQAAIPGEEETWKMMQQPTITVNGDPL